jgi:predicted enzyme related to lactoylglutathione lyase
MIVTRGLTHIHLMVRDLDRSLAFYKRVFGLDPDGYLIELLP